MEELKKHESCNPISSKRSNNSKEKSQEKVSGTFVKRNIIIIEILENFLIDDGSDNYIIDIEKLKMLLPKTWNIDDSYIKRLVYTDITSVNRAVTKLKSSKNTILREQLLNKITISMIELDKSVYTDKGTQNDKNNKNLNCMKNPSASKINNSLHYLNNTTYGFFNEEFEQKLFYENYLDLLVRIAENLKMTHENNKKAGDNLNKYSVEASFKDSHKSSLKHDKNN